MNMKVFIITFLLVMIVSICRERMAAASSLDEASQKTVIVEGEKEEAINDNEKVSGKATGKDEKVEADAEGKKEKEAATEAEKEAATEAEKEKEEVVGLEGRVFNTDELGSLGVCILFVLCLILAYCIVKVFFHKG